MGETQVTVLPGQHLWATYAITYIEWWPTIDEKKITVMATHANMKQLGNTGIHWAIPAITDTVNFRK